MRAEFDEETNAEKNRLNCNKTHCKTIEESKKAYEHACNKYETSMQDNNKLDENHDVEALISESLERQLHAFNDDHVAAQEALHREIKKLKCEIVIKSGRPKILKEKMQEARGENQT